jgi:two-component system chemotaxis response regulator CheY
LRRSKVPKDILIVDDCTFTTKVLARLMQEMGFNVATAGSAEEAVRFLETNDPPSLFFVDWVMPGMSGVEFVAWLRDQGTTDKTPVVMVTAQRDMSQIAEAIQSGANEYIMKPFSPEVIAEKLKILGIRVREMNG